MGTSSLLCPIDLTYAPLAYLGFKGERSQNLANHGHEPSAKIWFSCYLMRYEPIYMWMVGMEEGKILLTGTISL
jgi:hypothetical protein